MDFVIAAVFVAAIVAIGALIWRQTKAKGRFGLGSFRVNCPRCGSPLPVVRKPGSAKEMMWGGWTCPKCGCKVDKYGRERTAA